MSESSPAPWKRICVYAGSKTGLSPEFTSTALALGRTMHQRELGLVFGAGSVGLMGVIADEILRLGGEVIGVIPEFLSVKELLHSNLTQTIITHDMHERKARMAALADAFIALPGGLGTFEEVFEILTWAQLGVHQKPIGILNVAGYFDPFIQLIDHAVDTGFVNSDHRHLICVAESPEDLLEQMSNYLPPKLPHWMQLEET